MLFRHYPFGHVEEGEGGGERVLLTSIQDYPTQLTKNNNYSNLLDLTSRPVPLNATQSKFIVWVEVWVSK